jgi:hypothetical protein
METRAEIEPGSLRRLVQASRTWDKTSRAEMRKGLRLAASVGAEAAKREVMGAPPGLGTARRRSGRTWWIDAKGRKKSRGLRAGLSAGVKVSIQSGRESRSTGAVTGEGVRVTTTDSRLPGDQSPMVKAYMARAFRHPVFGRGWADQRGKNWFYGPLIAGREEYKRAVVAAIEAAARAVANN